MNKFAIKDILLPSFYGERLGVRLLLIFFILAIMSACTKEQKPVIIRSDIQLQSDTLTPEALWAMGRIGTYAISPSGRQVAFQVTYYSVKENRSNTVIYVQDIPEASSADADMSSASATSAGGASPLFLGPGSDPFWMSDTKIAFAHKGELWTMNAKGKSRKQLTQSDGAVEGFLFSPDQKKVILVKHVPFHDIIQERPADLPKTTGMVINDLMYRHWDHYVDAIPHPFILDLTSGKEFDMLEGQPYECPMEPFGGVEQLAWSPDSKHIAFTCRVKKGLDYSISTDSDIYLYDVEAAAKTSPLEALHAAINLCKEKLTYHEMLTEVSFPPAPNPTKTLKHQVVNEAEFQTLNPGYDQNPKFSPDGRYVAWLSMPRDGYESDRQRLCVYDLQGDTTPQGDTEPYDDNPHLFPKQYVTEAFDSGVDDFVWGADSYTLYYIGVWHATENLYRTNLKGEVTQLTSLQADWGSLSSPLPSPPRKEASQAGSHPVRLLMERHDFFHPADLYLVSIPAPASTSASPSTSTSAPAIAKNRVLGSGRAEISQLTRENDHILSQLAPGTSEPHWCKTTDGQDLHYWVIKPPHFDPAKKYPTLLFCEGGPQSPVSQFWSYRWNFYIMASQGYVIIAPNRRGLPGFGQEWLEEISGDWTGQCMADYLSAIDDACDNLPYVDRDRLGAVGASFGGFSVYYLAGHHEGRFKCFIAHDGAFNLEAMYTETEENWFSNWEYEDAYWNADRSANADKTYKNSPHLFVENWDTPILCIHGEKDYRINATQGMSAFNAARMKGIEAELLLFPDENHWVLKPQNGILWQRTFFNWLARWLK